MTPSGSIPSGPPCSLLTRILQLDNSPLPSHEQTSKRNALPNLCLSTLHARILYWKCPSKVTLRLSTILSPLAGNVVKRVKAPSLTALGPGPHVWKKHLSRVLRAPSSAPNSAQAGVIDAVEAQPGPCQRLVRTRFTVRCHRPLAVQSPTLTEPLEPPSSRNRPQIKPGHGHPVLSWLRHGSAYHVPHGEGQRPRCHNVS